MNISQAAKASGLSVKMIRNYEAIKLIPDALRSPAGYRTYSADDIAVLRFIKGGRKLGFSIENIRTLLALQRDKGRASAQVKELALSHIKNLQGQMTSLQSMINTLEGLVAHCRGDQTPDCPILNNLAHETCGANRP